MLDKIKNIKLFRVNKDIHYLFGKLKVKMSNNGNSIYLIRKHEIYLEIDLSYHIIWISSNNIIFNPKYKKHFSDKNKSLELVSKLLLKYFKIDTTNYKLFLFNEYYFYYFGFTNKKN